MNGLNMCDIYGGCAHCPAFGGGCDGCEDPRADGINEELEIEDEMQQWYRARRDGAKITVTETVIGEDGEVNA